jgi:hypothetical protein
MHVTFLSRVEECFPGMPTYAAMNLDEPVEVAPGVTKPLGDCTVDDLESAKEFASGRAARGRAATENLREGRAPKCDWREPDGSYCESDAEFIRDGGTTVIGAEAGH